MTTGEHGRYSWLLTDAWGIGQLLEHCPQAVLQRYVVIAAFDSGPLSPNENELAMGWHSEKDLLYTTKVGSVGVLPFDNNDEWYVFDSPVVVSNCEVFVNAGGFTLESPNQYFDTTWDRRIFQEDVERLANMQARFWNQMERFGAQSYIS